jgi:amine acid ABC transporter, permease protein, 3-TM region, His/Glu/Gln/Arg/opine family
MNWRLIYDQLPNLGEGALYTLGTTFVALLAGNILGLVAAIMRLSRFPWLNRPASAYVAAFRGTPMLVQILVFYNGIIPSLGFTRAPAIYAGLIALSLNSGAYMCEIFRGGIQSIDKGQVEAALSLGLTKTQAMRYVVLPQALANAMPAIGNEFITLIKDSSLVSVISVAELTYRANLVAARNWEYNTMYLAIAGMYFVMTFTTSKVLGYLEGRLRAGYAK